MSKQPETLSGEAGRLLPGAPGSALVSPPGKCLRSVRKVWPGWPQAHFELTCRHLIVVPTWDSGRTNPKPVRKLYTCHRCKNAKWKRWFRDHEAAWVKAHGEQWYMKPNAKSRHGAAIVAPQPKGQVSE